MEKRTIEITLETAKEWYNGDNEVLKNLALQTFTENELQVIDCVKSWEEFCEKYNTEINEYFIGSDSNILSFIGDERCICGDENKRYLDNDRNLLATKEDAEAFLALIQLKRLRDQWWEALNWKPDYTDCKITKYSIVLLENKLCIGNVYTMSKFLTFPTREIAEDFLNCFKELIEKAKDLI